MWSSACQMRAEPKCSAGVEVKCAHNWQLSTSFLFFLVFFFSSCLPKCQWRLSLFSPLFCTQCFYTSHVIPDSSPCGARSERCSSLSPFRMVFHSFRLGWAWGLHRPHCCCCCGCFFGRGLAWPWAQTVHPGSHIATGALAPRGWQLV